MRSAAEIAGLLGNLRATNVECLPNTDDADALAEAVCAFANDMPGSGEPGFLIVGANDAGQIVGLNVTDNPESLSAITRPQVDF